MPPECSGKTHLVYCGGRAVCPALSVPFLIVSFTFPSLRLQSILIRSEDWACSPWTIDHHFLVILEVDLGFDSDIQPRGRTPA